MYSRYVPNILLIAHKSRLLQIRWCGVAHCPMFSDWSRNFTDFLVDRWTFARELCLSVLEQDSELLGVHGSS